MKKKEKTTSIYILLTDTGSFLTKTIKMYTAAPYNHVSLALDKELNELYSFGRKHPRNPLYGGFVKEDIYKGTYRYFQNTRCTLLELRVTEQQLFKVKQTVRSFQLNEAAYIYNLAGLFGVMFNYPIELKNAYFCSQFVDEVLKKSGVYLWNKPSALVTPNEFLIHPSFKKRYEGKLYEYPLLKSQEQFFYQPTSLRKSFLLFPYKKIKSLF